MPAHAYEVGIDFDVPEPRVLRPRLVAAADGTTWDSGLNSHIYIDPVTRTSMLRPLPTTPEWWTTFTGLYARLRKTDYSGLTAAKWKESSRRVDGNWYLVSNGPVDETATTTTAYLVNQPMYLSLYVEGFESLAEQTFLECGWGTPGAAGSVWLRFRADGSVSVYKGAARVGSYEWKGGALAAPDSQRSAPDARQGRTMSVMLLPCRWNRLLVVADGAGFEHEFADIPFAPGPQPTITPAAPFFWKVPTAAGGACVQCAPLRFKAAGSLYSRPIQLRFPPPVGAVFGPRYFADAIGASVASAVTVALANVADGTPFVPDGLIDEVRLLCNLSGDGTGTPGLYAADAVLPPVATTTANAPVDVTCLMQEVEISVPERGPATLSLMSRRLEDLDAAGVEQVQTLSDRPFRVRVGAVDVLRGTVSQPRLTLGLGHVSDWAREAAWQGLDRDAELNFSKFQDAYAYDNSLLTDAVATLWQDVGVAPSLVTVTADGFRLPFSPACSMGEFALIQQRGETRGEWLDRLQDAYAKTWVRGWRPDAAGYRWWLVDPATLPTAPAARVFEGANLARAFGIVEANVPTLVMQGPVYEVIPPEANQVLVIGYDPRARRHVTAQWDDAASQNPQTLPALRPLGWRGRLHSVEYQSMSVQTQAVADRVRDFLSARLGTWREVVTWGGDLLLHASGVPLWKGDAVEVAKDVTAPGVAVARGVYRIIEIPRMRLVSNLYGVRPVWQCTYRGELI